MEITTQLIFTSVSLPRWSPKRGQLADLRDEQLLWHRHRCGSLPGLPQRPRGESQPVQLPAAQQGVLREDGTAQDCRPQGGQGSAQGAPPGGRWQDCGSATRRWHHYLEYTKVSSSHIHCHTKTYHFFGSWGSGANPWGPDKDDHFTTPNHYDGMLEVVGVTGVVHLGQIQSGIRTAMRIAQVRDSICFPSQFN